VQVKADLSIDFSQFNLSKIFDKVQTMVSEATGFNIDFELPALPGSSGTPGGLPPLLGELGSKLNFLAPFLDFNALRDGLSSSYVPRHQNSPGLGPGARDMPPPRHSERVLNNRCSTCCNALSRVHYCIHCAAYLKDSGVKRYSVQ
jgi:hypothetical protein